MLPFARFSLAELKKRYDQGQTRFERLDLRHLSLEKANFPFIEMVECNLQGVNLSASFFPGATFDLTRLRQSWLNKANLIGSTFVRADLSGAQLNQAMLSGAQFTGANLSEACLAEASLSGCDLRGTNLKRANLRGASLQGANLQGADLRNADLTGADLTGANLLGTLMPDATYMDYCFDLLMAGTD